MVGPLAKQKATEAKAGRDTVKHPKKRKPLGKPIVWDESDLEHMSRVTATDKKASVALWHNEAPAKLKNLLLAAVEERQQ